jgi:hypothetical protein
VLDSSPEVSWAVLSRWDGHFVMRCICCSGRHVHCYAKSICCDRLCGIRHVCSSSWCLADMRKSSASSVTAKATVILAGVLQLQMANTTVSFFMVFTMAIKLLWR